MDGLLALLRPHVERARATPGELIGMGVGVCGLVETATGRVSIAPNLHWLDVPLGERIGARFGLPVFAATDTRLAAIGEATWGAGRGVQNFVWVTLGSGLGGCLVLNGQPYGGDHGFAGAFGHNTVDEIAGRPCGCGRRGCLETYVSGWAIAREAQAAVEAGHPTRLRDTAGDERITAQMVFRAEAEGDGVAKHIIAQAVRRLAIGLGGLVNTLDVRLIIAGGGVARGSPEFLGRVEALTREHLFSPEARRDLRILPESLPNAVLFGAAANVFRSTGTR